MKNKEIIFLKYKEVSTDVSIAVNENILSNGGKSVYNEELLSYVSNVLNNFCFYFKEKGSEKILTEDEFEGTINVIRESFLKYTNHNDYFLPDEEFIDYVTLRFTEFLEFTLEL